MNQTEIFIRIQLGQKTFYRDSEYDSERRPDHLRFDMGGNRDDNEGDIENDKIWGIFEPYLGKYLCARSSYNETRPIHTPYVFIFHKGGGYLFKNDPKHNDIHRMDEIKSYYGDGTVGILLDLFVYFNVNWKEIKNNHEKT